ncbi:glutamate racemase [Aquimarina algicola]|uniref:Glutamate racemase n=1 Tax=Aquimarina algicola TaxID=2589995 RepID=A0A504J677_9FLAO|nr:glutamate racemase [Aquimarina algicola]TPN86014.1 glutamate racemase [Aquimarina algicola]
MQNQAIGIFDSGIGGTSIWKEIVDLLPNENTIYLADSKYAPYGRRSKSEIIDLSIKNTNTLLERNCKIIVVACNTATTNAIQILRDTYPVPFIGIEPAIKPAAIHTQTKSVGILATKGTLSSELFTKTSDLYAQNIKVTEVIGSGLVELIEENKIHSEEMKSLLQSYLAPMLKNDIDYLVLGCSHYSYLVPILQNLLPKKITIIDSGEAVARQTRAMLSKHQILNQNKKSGTHQLYTNGNPIVLKNILKDLKREYTIDCLHF